MMKMKKIVSVLTAMLAVLSINGQTLEKSKFFDNTYIGLNTGVSGWLHPTCNNFDNFGKSIKSVSSLRIGKMITPILGIEIEGEVGMANQIKFVDHTTVGANMLFNLNNAFHPYRGEPDNVEFLPFIGLGWHHTYGIVTNNLASKFGMQINFNVDKKKAWQINIIPSINYIMTDNGFSSTPTGQPRLDACRAFVNLQVGVTYRFKNSKGSHNFVISPYKYTQSDYDELMDKINKQRKIIAQKDKALRASRLAIHSLTNRTDSINNKNTNPIDIETTIGFNIGQADINPIQRGNLLRIAKIVKENNLKIHIIGYADKNTGTNKRNLELSKMRATNVAKELQKLGVREDAIVISGVGSEQQIFEENDANRVVIFTVDK